MELFTGIIVLVLSLAIYELRLKRPDQIILFEKRGEVKQRKGRFFPRHFSLAVPATTHSILVNVGCEAKGKLELTVKVSLSAAASKNEVSNLIRVGGWSVKAVEKSSAELEIFLEGLVREHTEKLEIEDLNSEGIHKHLIEKSKAVTPSLGIDIVSLSVQSIEPVNKEIATALRLKEEARITEATEKTNQLARIAAAKSKYDADEIIAREEHKFKLKKLELKKLEEEKEELIANRRIEEEIRRSNIRLEFDKKELEMLRENPELLMLTPQVARLAEASQNLKNAKTVVSLSGNEFEKSTEFAGLLQAFIQNMTSKYSSEKK